MLIGWCAPPADADMLARLGFDFIEVPLAACGLESAGTRAAARATLAGLPLPAAAFNYFFPHDMRVVGPGVDVPRIKNYLAHAAALMHDAKARVCVLGSGWARNAPVGFPHASAEQQFTEALGWCADALAGSGVTLVIEPLNRKESDLVNSVADGARFAAAVARPQIRVLADFYHMDEEHEPLDALVANRDWLAHIHLADTGRRNPGTGRYDYETFFGHLKSIGYTGMISVECQTEDREAEMRHSLHFLRRHWPASAPRLT
ncbi:MAG: sugar phosphate isomerase/epimerase family protein [Hyphomicrobiaceae bacterium]